MIMFNSLKFFHKQLAHNSNAEVNFTMTKWYREFPVANWSCSQLTLCQHIIGETQEFLIKINTTYDGDHFVMYKNTKSPCVAPQANTILYVSYNSIKKECRKSLP